MLTQGRFLISYQVFDNIQVNNIGQTHVREILKDTQAFTINYRTEQIRDYLKYPGEELISEHLHMINALKEIRNYWNLTSEKVIITDIRDVLKSYIIARYYGWEPKEEDLEEIISNTSYFDIHVDDAIYEVLTMPREKNNYLKQRTYENNKSFIKNHNQSEW